MKKFVCLFFIAFAFSAVLYAEQGPFTGYITSDGGGNNRSVLIVNTVTGDFEVYDIDNKALSRKEDAVYYDCIKYDRAAKKREVHMIKIREK